MAFPPMVMLAVSIMFATDRFPTEAVKKEMEALRGTWTIVSIQSENSLGKEIFKEGSSFIIEDGKMTFKMPSGTNPGTSKINVASNPPTLDFSSQHFRTNHGVSPLDSWLRIQGIYRLKGDSLTICMIFQCDASMLSRDRPTDFTTHGDKNRVLLVLHRENPDPKTPPEKRSKLRCRRLK
jgi:uncharacterized protein (TIGR03067 family)